MFQYTERKEAVIIRYTETLFRIATKFMALFVIKIESYEEKNKKRKKGG